MTDEEEKIFNIRCNNINDDTNGPKKYSQYLAVSKGLSTKLRHSTQRHLFSSSGSVSIENTFVMMDWASPINKGNSGLDFAALLLCNEKARFFVEVNMNWSWKPFGFPPTRPFEIRSGCTQGHSNRTVDPTTAKNIFHALTYDECMSLGWIFHVTSASNRRSIEERGLLMNSKGKGRGGRDAVHHNDGSAGYIPMADGTVPPRIYDQPIYCVLLPDAIVHNQLFLSKNGVVLVYGDIPAVFLRIVDQQPTIASNILGPGRGHRLPSSVTGGTWPRDITYERVMQEKGSNFQPGGLIPTEVRLTAWEFMGQTVPKNYGTLIFAQPLSTRDSFDPAADSIYGLLGDQDDGPPVEDPQEEEEGGCSQEGEEPQSECSQEGEVPEEENPDQQEEIPPQEAQDAAVMDDDDDQDRLEEKEVEAWIEEGREYDDEITDHATSSVSASNPWILYEAGIICARDEEGVCRRNSSGEKVVNLREWHLLLSEQRIALRRQNIRRPEWEKLPWTGHLCFLFTRAWEIGRRKSHHHRSSELNEMHMLYDSARENGSGWMRGFKEPQSWNQRYDVNREQRSEQWLFYERDLSIQADLEWLSEAVYQFYQVHLDKMIRSNDKLWGDFRRKKQDWDETAGVYVTTEYLDLNTFGYKMRSQHHRSTQFKDCHS